jgi:hypothetical protein
MAADPYTVNKGASEEDIQARIVGPSKVYTVVPTMRSGDARRHAGSGGLLPAATCRACSIASSLQSTLSPRMATRPGNGGAAYSVSLADQADPVMTEILVEQSWLIALGLFLAVAVGIAVWTHKMPG